jgi:hypothetical protein
MCAPQSFLRGLLLLGSCALLGASVRAQSALLVVDDDGGPGVFSSIAAAVDVAPTGAVILVKAGNYGPFEIVARTLVIVAEPGADVVVHGGVDANLSPAIVVRDLGVGDVVVLEGLTASGTTDLFGSGSLAVAVTGCAGQVWLQDGSFTGGMGATAAGHGLHVVDSQNVLVMGCTLQGASAVDWSAGGVLVPGDGLHASGSRVHAWDTHAEGGTGASGVAVDDGFLFASRSVLTGGQGLGLPSGFGCLIHINGGAGLTLGPGSPTAVLFGTQLVAGAADLQGCSEMGTTSVVHSGTLQTLPGTAPGFTATSPALDGAPLTLAFPGATPGDHGLVLLATSLGNVPFVGKYSGALAVGSPWSFLVGPVPASGTLEITLNLGDALPPGTGATFFAQGALLKAAGGAVLAAPAALTQYDG